MVRFWKTTVCAASNVNTRWPPPPWITVSRAPAPTIVTSDATVSAAWSAVVPAGTWIVGLAMSSRLPTARPRNVSHVVPSAEHVAETSSPRPVTVMSKASAGAALAKRHGEHERRDPGSGASLHTSANTGRASRLR